MFLFQMFTNCFAKASHWFLKLKSNDVISQVQFFLYNYLFAADTLRNYIVIYILSFVYSGHTFRSYSVKDTFENMNKRVNTS